MRRCAATMLSLASFTLGAGAVPAHAATTLHAGPGGSAAAATCPDAAPCSITRALALATTGDTVVVKPGEHRPPGTLDVKEGVTVQGAPGPRPVIIGPPGATAVRLGPDAANPVAASRLRHVRIESSGSSALELRRDASAEDLVVVGAGAGSATVVLLNTNSLRSAAVINTGAGPTSAVMSRGDPGEVIVLNPISTLRNVTAVATSPQGRGIVAFAPARYSSYFAQCVRSDVTMNLRNVLARGGVADIQLLGQAGASCPAGPTGNARVNVDHSNFRTLDPGVSTVNQTGATTLGLNNQTLAALTADSAIFADAEFRQKPGAPTIDAGGFVDLLPPTDIDGDPIPSLGAPDIGADEFVPGPPPPATPPAAAVQDVAAGAGPAAPAAFRLLSGLSAPKRITRAALLRGGLPISFALGQPRSGYSLTLTTKVRRRGRTRTRTLGTLRAVNQADGSVRARLRLSRSGRAAVRSTRRNLTATLRAKVTGTDGLAQTGSQSVTVTR